MLILISGFALVTVIYATSLVVKDIHRESRFNGMAKYIQTLEKELDRFDPPRT